MLTVSELLCHPWGTLNIPGAAVSAAATLLHDPRLGRVLLERKDAEGHLPSSFAPGAVRGPCYLDNGRVRRLPDGVRALSDEQARKRLAAPALERR